MRFTAIIAAFAAIWLGGSSCQKTSGGDDLIADTPRSIDLSTKSEAFVRKGNAFAFEFLRRTDSSEKGGFIISPLSMQFLLGMVLDGARGETAGQICEVLGYGSGETEAVNEYCLSMLKALPGLDARTTLAIANAIYVDDGWPLLAKYTDTVGEYYEAAVSNLDFSDGKGSAARINKWCSDRTGGLVPEVIDETDEEMLAYLLNATYFRSSWSSAFPKGSTASEAFYSADGKKTDVVRMMKKNDRLSYFETDILRAVRLPYGNGAYTMTVLLPTDGKTTADVCSALKDTDWSGFTGSMGSAEVDLWLPKFETEFKIRLNDMLSDMGMPYAFDEFKADFKAMSDYALCLSFVQQNAAIKVDEDGTEAAAVSVAGMIKATSAGPADIPVVFHADHPFLYIISEESTGAILFAGRFTGK